MDMVITRTVHSDRNIWVSVRFTRQLCQHSRVMPASRYVFSPLIAIPVSRSGNRMTENGSDTQVELFRCLQSVDLLCSSSRLDFGDFTVGNRTAPN